MENKANHPVYKRWQRNFELKQFTDKKINGQLPGGGFTPISPLISGD